MPVNLGNLFINGDGTIEDATSNHTLHSITNTTVDTSEKKFGSGSLNMGNTGKIYVNNSSAFNLGQNQFTIDFWIKSNFADTWQGIYEHRDSSSGLNDLTVYMNGSGQVFFNSRISGSNVVFVSTQSGVSANEWHHIAVVRRGSGLNDMSIFFDGVAQTLVWSTPLTVGAQMATMSTDPVIGQGESAGFGPGGHLDNFRWVNGLALWGTNFSLDSGSLLYQLPDYNPTRLDEVSKLYNLSSIKNNLRGKAKMHYARPTIKQFFTSTNYNGPILPSDDFIGSTLNTERWDLVGTAPEEVVHNDGVHLDITGGGTDKTARLNNKFKLTGDFDIQVSVDNVLIGNVNTGYAMLYVMNDDASSQMYVGLSSNNNGQLHYRCNAKNSGTWESSVYVRNTSNTSSIYRLTRVGNTITARYWYNGGWSTAKSSSISSMGQAYAVLYSGSWAPGRPNLRVSWKNFKVTGDAIYVE